MSGRTVSSPGRRLRVFILCTAPGPPRVFSGVDRHGSPLYRRPLARLFSLVNFTVCHLEMSKHKGFIHIWSGLHKASFLQFYLTTVDNVRERAPFH